MRVLMKNDYDRLFTYTIYVKVNQPLKWKFLDFISSPYLTLTMIIHLK